MDFEENIRLSFEKVKEEIASLRKTIKYQNDIIRLISQEITNSNTTWMSINPLENPPSRITPKSPSSIGNKGVTHSLTHSLTTHSPLTHSPLNKHFNTIKGTETIKDTLNKLFPEIDWNRVDLPINNHLSLNQPRRGISESFSVYKARLNKIFETLSKQEINIILTIYQMEDDNIKDIGYFELAQKIRITTDCMRSYISRLRKKEVPIIITKFNNQRTLLSIDKEFKSLNLKQKLIDLYYGSTISQKSLFDSI